MAGNYTGHLLVQTDGMRFTTTAKSGFITGLYVLFTPLIAVAAGQRIKLTSGHGSGNGQLWALPAGFVAGRLGVGGMESRRSGNAAVRDAVWRSHRADGRFCAAHRCVAAGRNPGDRRGIMSVVQPRSCQRRMVIRMWRRAVPTPCAGRTAYLAIFSTVFAFWGQAIAQTQLGPAEAAVLFCIEPVTAALLSVFWLKESMTTRQVAGGALIVLAMIVSEALPYMFRAITVPDTRP